MAANIMVECPPCATSPVFMNQSQWVGFTLLECLLALMLSSVILLALFSFALSCEHAWRFEQQQLSLLIQAKQAVSVLTQAIKQAGKGACLSPSSRAMPLRLYTVSAPPPGLPTKDLASGNVLVSQQCGLYQKATQALTIAWFVRREPRDKNKPDSFALYRKILSVNGQPVLSPAESWVRHITHLHIIPCQWAGAYKKSPGHWLCVSQGYLTQKPEVWQLGLQLFSPLTGLMHHWSHSPYLQPLHWWWAVRRDENI